MSSVDGGNFRGDARRNEIEETATSKHAAPGLDLLDAVLVETATQPDPDEPHSPLDRLLASKTTSASLAAWCVAVKIDPSKATLGQVARLLNRDVARIDALVSNQVNSIIHHPRFQRLEASWRGISYLVDQIEDPSTKIRILNVSWKTLVRDLDRSIEFDQSQLFKKVYSEEFGTSGGEPFSVLIGDYDIRPRPRRGNPMDDLTALRSISHVAAAAFAPFIASAHPSLLGLDNFSQLQRPMNLAAIFEQPEFHKWTSLRATEEARFVGLTMPKVLMRRTYEDDGSRSDGFRFNESVRRPNANNYLWGNAAYAYGAVLIRAFSQCGWLADVRGATPGLDEGGLVKGLPVLDYGVDASGVATRSSTDVIITDEQQDQLDKLGFVPLSHCKGTPYSAFFSGASIQKPEQFHEQVASANARLSAMLPYMLCVSRVAHYFKVLGREKIGSYADASDVQGYLNTWLQKYVTQDDDASPEVKARYPLREARVAVREQPGKPGSYYCVVHLQPHYQLDDVSSSVALTTELSPATA